MLASIKIHAWVIVAFVIRFVCFFELFTFGFEDRKPYMNPMLPWYLSCSPNWCQTYEPFFLQYHKTIFIEYICMYKILFIELFNILKKYFLRIEKAHSIWCFDVFAKDLSLTPRTEVRMPRTNCNSSCSSINTLFSPLQSLSHRYRHRDREWYINIS